MMLDGIRVLDLSRVIAGPYCATLMADLGADVVKVERPGRGDDLRAWRGDGMSATFAAINRNKRGIAVDLQHPEGARLVLELARRVDVLVENFLPGVAPRAPPRSCRPLLRLWQAPASPRQPESQPHTGGSLPHQGRLGPGRHHEPRPVRALLQRPRRRAARDRPEVRDQRQSPRPS